ncbi:MerR family transcriptional regulator [Sinanaerobacter sp. ZZT-01]|uniref:MerR family transcriptional regulator n=1 Tax=Sinanaerobacter sp. ZZT-01 TaxID=3111540 RepID=UPI002D79933E|nr:MerR family transcriptional regulator [Sinanaerobacter sp. ZZT-01]WRR93253.1 MerR family transcriptional regulator [Sinanaerobacter sp. ZZT-01]
MNTYKTAEVAKMIGIHPNTVRLYEKWGLIPQAERLQNGYRIFTEFHIDQLRLVRTAFQIELLQNGLRKKIIEILKISATKNFEQALNLTAEYLFLLRQEQIHAEEAIQITNQLLSCEPYEIMQPLKRKEVSEYLNVSMDSLRNWEMNGLLSVKRKENGYRIYTIKDIKRLKIIRSLRFANYSLEAILRMLNELSYDPETNIRQALNTVKKDAEIRTVCDELMGSLKAAKQNAKKMIEQLQTMKIKY